jgi:hypothetical protein
MVDLLKYHYHHCRDEIYIYLLANKLFGDGKRYFPVWLSFILGSWNQYISQCHILMKTNPIFNLVFWYWYHGLTGEVDKRHGSRLIKGLRRFLKMPLGSRRSLATSCCVLHSLPLPPPSIYSGNPTPSRQRQLAAMAALKSCDQATPAI